MVRLRQHVPGFVNDGQGGWTLTAPTLNAVLALPQVAVYANDVEPVERHGSVTGWPNGVETTVEVIHDAPEEQRFYRWSLADRNTLMVEHNHGDHFWVVGYLSADDPSELAGLPAWVETETARLRRLAWNRGEMPKQKSYRCAAHGIDRANCCLSTHRTVQ